jgi:hypothetical protein
MNCNTDRDLTRGFTKTGKFLENRFDSILLVHKKPVS